MSSDLIRALLLFDRDRIAEAEAVLRQAIEGGDDSADVHAMIALCLLHWGLQDRAKQEVALALQREPESALAHYVLTYVQEAALEFMRVPLLGESPIEGSKSRALVRTARHAVELDPQEPRYWTRLAEILQRLDQWHKSLEPAERALALAPDHVHAAVLRAEALARLRRHAEARATLMRALERNPEAAAAHTGIGWALLRAGDPDRALQFFQEALRMNASLEWAQEGALECAKHRYRIYGVIFRAKTWFAAQHMVARAVLGLVGLVAACAALVGVFELFDPLVRPRLGNQGTALLFVPIMFGVIILAMFHDEFFLWLVRRDTAAQTTTGAGRLAVARNCLGLVAFALAGGMVIYALKKEAKTLLTVLLGTGPGVYLHWMTWKQIPGGVRKLGWWVYSAGILVAGLVIGLTFQETIGHWDRRFLLVLLCLPLLPLGVAIEVYKKRDRARQHDAAIALYGKTSDPDKTL